MLDNSKLIEKFVPDEFDGDTFIYTEMLDRGKRKGNNGHRLVKTFYHRSKEEFQSQLEQIKFLCDKILARACTRLAPRSYKKVGREFTKLVVETALTENWSGMKSLYNRACGITSPNQKYWLFDVDVVNKDSEELGKQLEEMNVLISTIPSKKGLHYITVPFNQCLYLPKLPDNIQIHKDNPTNLYIPDGAN